MSADFLELDTVTRADEGSAASVRERAGNVLRPPGALRRLDELAVWLATWQRTSEPAVNNPAVVIFGGDHGVAVDGVSAYPSSVTAAMLDALTSGTATAAVMARQVGASLSVIDVGVGKPTGNIRLEPAMGIDGFRRAVQVGRESVGAVGPSDLLVIGEIGIGNTTPAAAIAYALFGGAAGNWVGPGAGLDSEGLAQKTRVVEEAVGRVAGTSPVGIMRELGGWELAAMAGAVIEARQRSIPVLLDGFVVTSALMPLEVISPGYLDHCWPAHVSAEPGHRALVTKLGRQPVLDLEMCLGEGSGALAAIPIVGLAARTVVEVATFEEWGLA